MADRLLVAEPVAAAITARALQILVGPVLKHEGHARNSAPIAPMLLDVHDADLRHMFFLYK